MKNEFTPPNLKIKAHLMSLLRIDNIIHDQLLILIRYNIIIILLYQRGK